MVSAYNNAAAQAPADFVEYQGGALDGLILIKGNLQVGNESHSRRRSERHTQGSVWRRLHLAGGRTDKGKEPEQVERAVHFAPESEVRTYWRSKATASSHLDPNSTYFAPIVLPSDPVHEPPPQAPLTEADMVINNNAPNPASEPSPSAHVGETPVPRFHKLRVQYAFEKPMTTGAGLHPASLMVALQASPFGDKISLLEVMGRLAARHLDTTLPATTRAGYIITSSTTQVTAEPLNLSTRTSSVGHMQSLVLGHGDAGDDSQFFDPPSENETLYIWIKLVELVAHYQTFEPRGPEHQYTTQELPYYGQYPATSTRSIPQVQVPQPQPLPAPAFLQAHFHHHPPSMSRSYSEPVHAGIPPFHPNINPVPTSAPTSAPQIASNTQYQLPAHVPTISSFPLLPPPFQYYSSQAHTSIPLPRSSTPFVAVVETPAHSSQLYPPAPQSSSVSSVPLSSSSQHPLSSSSQHPASNVSATPSQNINSTQVLPDDATPPPPTHSSTLNPAELQISYSLVTPNGTWSHSVLVPSQTSETGKSFTEPPQWSMKTGNKRLHLPPEGKSGGKAKAFSRKCQGVDVCTRERCPGIARPPVTKEAVVGQCRICRNPLRRVDCMAVWWVMDVPENDEQKRVWHVGWRDHPTPPALHVRSEAIDALVNLHHSRPSATPASLRQGVFASQPENPLFREAAVKLHPKFSSTNAIKRTLVNTLGTTSGPSSSRSGDLKLFDVRELNKELKGFIAKSNPNGMLFLQTPMMRRWIGDETSLSKRISVAGMCTDGDNGFLEAKYVLQATVCYSPILTRWVPVAYATMPGQTAEEFAVFFAWVLESMEEEQYSTEEILDQIRSVLDYSPAQAKGFDEAIIDWYVRTKQRTESTELSTPEHQAEWQRDGKLIAQARRRGCEQHFEASARRIGRNSAVVPPNSESKFFSAAKAFQRSHTAESRAARLADLIREFPLAEGWSRWWTTGSAAEMILSSSMTMGGRDQREIPVTTNPVEALHHLLGAGCEGSGHSLVVGIRHAYNFILMLEEMYNNALAGYPSANLSHTNIRARSGTTRPEATAAFPPNDGNPPQKTSELLEAIRPSPSMEKLSPTKAKKFAAAAPSRETDPPPSRAVSGWMRGANVAILDVEWNHNSCWLDSSLMVHTQLWIHNNGDKPTGAANILTEILRACAGRSADDFRITGLTNMVVALQGIAGVHCQPSKFSRISDARAALTGVRDRFREQLADGYLGRDKAFGSNPWWEWYNEIWERALRHPYRTSDSSKQLPKDLKTPPIWTLPAHLIHQNFLAIVNVDVCPGLHARFSRHVWNTPTFGLDETDLPWLSSGTVTRPPLDLQQLMNSLWNGWGSRTAETHPCWRYITVAALSSENEANNVGICDEKTCSRGKRLLGLPFVLPVRIAHSSDHGDISGHFSFPSTLVFHHLRTKHTWDLVARQNKRSVSGGHFTTTVRIASKQTANFDSMNDEPHSFASVEHHARVGDAAAAVSGARPMTAGVYYRYRGKPEELATIYLARLEAYFAFTKLAHAAPADPHYRTGFGPGSKDTPVPARCIYWKAEGTPLKHYRYRWLDVERTAGEMKKLFQELSPAEVCDSLPQTIDIDPYISNKQSSPAVKEPSVRASAPTSAPRSAPAVGSAAPLCAPISLSTEWVMRCTGCGEGSVHGVLWHEGRPADLIECTGCRTWGHIDCCRKAPNLSGPHYRCNVCSSGRLISTRRRQDLEKFATTHEAAFRHILSDPPVCVHVEVNSRWYLARVVDFAFLLDSQGAFHIIYPPSFNSATHPVIFPSHRVIIDFFRHKSAENRSRFKIGLVSFEEPVKVGAELSYHERRLRVDPPLDRVDIIPEISEALTPSTSLLLQLLDERSAHPSISLVPALGRWKSISLGLHTPFDSPLSVVYGKLRIGEMEQIVAFLASIFPDYLHTTWQWHCALEHCATLVESFRHLASGGDAPIDWGSASAVSNAYLRNLHNGTAADGHAGKGETNGEPVMYDDTPDEHDHAFEAQLWVAAADAQLHEPNLEMDWTRHGRNSFTDVRIVLTYLVPFTEEIYSQGLTADYWRTYNGVGDMPVSLHPNLNYAVDKIKELHDL
ncbi:hypothetical protein P7C70_g7173, partial [Phenoliferia sp. Uapishka_3]